MDLLIENADIAQGDQLLIARAKLPDDLALSEFTLIAEQLQTMVSFGYYAASRQSRWSDEFAQPDAEVVRVQYGSDLVVVVTVIGVVGAALIPIANVVNKLTEAWSTLEDAKLKREQRLALKEERLAKRELTPDERMDARRELMDLQYGGRATEGIQNMRVSDLQRLVDAVVVMSRYGIDIRVQPGADDEITGASAL